ncbi:MAG: hypothetical protein ACRCYV_07275 [Aeromonas sp.]
MARLTDKEWREARKIWERDPRSGHAWLVADLNLPLSRVAVAKRAKAEGWSKHPKAAEGAKVTAKKVTVEAKKVTPAPRKVTQRRAKVTEAAKGEVTLLPSQADTGRPPDLKPEFVDIAYNLMLLGFTREKLAHAFGVEERTIYRWQQHYPEFAQAVFRGGVQADGEVARALYDRALGSTVPDTHVAVIEGQVVQTPIEKHFPPETAAARMWLKNRQPELWKDKVELVEKPTIALVDKEAMDGVYERVLAEAAERRNALHGRAQRMGLTLDGNALAIEEAE